MILFKDRKDALKKLLATMPLTELKAEPWTLIAISEGGVIIADGIAKHIWAEADYLFTEGISAPNNKDCYIAMVSETEEIVINHNFVDSFDISIDYIYGEAKRKHDEQILKYLYKYRKGDLILDLAGKNVMIVDEGADTGLTLMVALKTIMNLKAHKIAVALPVIPYSLAVELEKIVDALYCVRQQKHYVLTESYYESLTKPTYEELVGLQQRYKRK